MFLKKYTSIGLLFIFLLAAGPLPRLAQAEEGDVFQACQSPDFRQMTEDWDALRKKTNNEMEEAFEEAQKKYHDYMSCLFGIAFEHVLKDKRGKTQGALSAQITSVNWMLPGQACLPEDELIHSIKGTAPEVILPQALEALEAYKGFLFKLKTTFSKEGQMGDIPEDIAQKAGSNVQAFRLIIQKNERKMDNEIKSSLMALEISFNALKELRLNFVAHVRFQCILRALGTYQQELRKIRRLVETLPKSLQNASLAP